MPWLLRIWQATLSRPIAGAELPDCCTPGAIRRPRGFSEAAPVRSIRKRNGSVLRGAAYGPLSS